MQKRNKYMISNSSLVIALFDGQPGGTKSTLDMAKKQVLISWLFLHKCGRIGFSFCNW